MMESRPSDLFQPGDLINNTYRIEQLLGAAARPMSTRPAARFPGAWWR